MSIFGWSYPPGCSGTPYDDGPDEDTSKCAWCGATLPTENPPEGSWEFAGVCNAQCAVYQAFADLGVEHDRVPPKNITEDYRDMILQAVAELEPRNR